MTLVTNYNALSKWYDPLRGERTALYKLVREKEKAKQSYIVETSRIDTINTQIRERLPEMLDLQNRIRIMERQAGGPAPVPARRE